MQSSSKNHIDYAIQEIKDKTLAKLQEIGAVPYEQRVLGQNLDALLDIVALTILESLPDLMQDFMDNTYKEKSS